MPLRDLAFSVDNHLIFSDADASNLPPGKPQLVIVKLNPLTTEAQSPKADGGTLVKGGNMGMLLARVFSQNIVNNAFEHACIGYVRDVHRLPIPGVVFAMNTHGCIFERHVLPHPRPAACCHA